MRRPLFWVAAGLVSGSILASHGAIPGSLIPFMFAALGAILPSILRERSAWAAVGIVIIFFGAGALLWNVRHAEPIGDPLIRLAFSRPESTIYELTGEVERPDIVLGDSGYMQFILRVDEAKTSAEHRPITGGTLVRWTNPNRPLYSGQRVRVSGELERTIGPVNPGVSGVEDHYRRRGVHTVLRIRGPGSVDRVARASRLSPFFWASYWRNSLAMRIAPHLHEDIKPFVLTVLLGDRRRIANDDYRVFLESGTAHILAVSGVHMSIVFLTVAFALRLVLKNLFWRTLLTMTAILLFALIAGARVSSLRAAVMFGLYLTADLFERERDATTALSLSAILFTLIQPDVLNDAGFRLSFLSVASLLLFSEPLGEKLTGIPPWLRKPLAVAFSVQLLPFPVAISMFHVLPIAGTLVNLLVIPLLTVVLWLSILVSLCSFVLPPAALLFGHALHPVVGLIQWLVESAASLRGSHIYLTIPTSWAVVAYYGATACFLVALLRWSMSRWPYAAAACLAATILLWNPWRSESEITFIDVGQGDSTFVRTPSGATMLIDGGDRYGSLDMGQRAVAPFLWANHVRRLDYVIATHSDSDHIGGLRYVLDHLRVGAAVFGPQGSNAQLANDLAKQCADLKIPILRVKAGDHLRLGGATAEVLHPPEDWPTHSSDNDQSVTLRVSWPGMSALLTGDIEAEAEARLAKERVAATILKVPHHGSKTSSSSPFVEAVEPRIAVISTGRPSQRSVLNGDVLQRYRVRGAEPRRTDTLGGIRITQKPAGLKVEGARQKRDYPLPGF
ncbi:MAG: DNA internalization-related competence protein ComEC/Rec2 [Candidatus Hydrogenedentes bacterium]|nr:DNA internalization-related competence protein ComEC/Rec2 [Candidatus Hydrogenedentota bacterium]